MAAAAAALVAVIALRARRATVDAVVAELVEASAPVEVQRPGGETIAELAGAKLRAGDELGTGPDVGATLIFPATITRVHLGAETRATVDSGAALSLAAGAVEVDGSLDVLVPGARASGRSARFRLALQGGGADLDVRDGVVLLSAAGEGARSHRVRAGERARTAGGAVVVARPSALLAAPSAPPEAAAEPPRALVTRPGLYGNTFSADSTWGVPVVHGAPMAFRFRAEHGGAIQALRYGSGVGALPAGAARTPLVIELRSDDGTLEHRPGAAVLGTTVVAMPEGKFPLVQLDRPVEVDAGALYHVVFSRPRADALPPVSVNNLWVARPTDPPHPGRDGADMALLSGRGGTWSVRRGFTPILEVRYADGAVTGQGYMEVWVANARAIEGANKVRETFTVAGPERHVASVSVRLRREGTPGPLRLRLERADGTLLEEGTIAPAAVDTTDAWVTLTFARPHTLEHGASYDLELSAPAGDRYRIIAIADGGVYYGFRSPSLFADGYAQLTSGGAWTGWDMWGKSDRKDGDLQLYFTEAP
jgi:hypothetical protein